MSKLDPMEPSELEASRAKSNLSGMEEDRRWPTSADSSDESRDIGLTANTGWKAEDDGDGVYEVEGV